METNHQLNALANDYRTERLAPTGRRFVRAVAVAVLLAVGAPTMATAGEEDRSAAPTVEASADMSSSQLAAPLAPASSHRGGQPDRVADYVGGIAARVHSDDGERIPGDLFLLMALAGSDTDARLYDHTPYLLDSDQTHPETIESNQQPVRTIEAITDTDLQMVNFTSAPGGGPQQFAGYRVAARSSWVAITEWSGDSSTGEIGLRWTVLRAPRGGSRWWTEEQVPVPRIGASPGS
jgi:hypothetical protein